METTWVSPCRPSSFHLSPSPSRMGEMPRLSRGPTKASSGLTALYIFPQPTDGSKQTCLTTAGQLNRLIQGSVDNISPLTLAVAGLARTSSSNESVVRCLAAASSIRPISTTVMRLQGVSKKWGGGSSCNGTPFSWDTKRAAALQN